MKPLLNQTSNSIEELQKKADILGLVMSDIAVDAAVKLTETLDTINRSMSAFGVSIGAELLPIIQEMSDKFIENMPKIKATVMPVINGFINTFKFLAEHIKGITITAGIMFGVFAACNVINTTAAAISTLGNIINTVKAAQGIWNTITRASITLQNFEYIKTAALIGIKTSYTAVLKAFTIAQRVANITMLGCPLWAIVAGFTAIIGVLVLVVKNWDSVTETVKNWGKTAINWVVNVWEKIKPIFEKIIKFAKIAFSFTPVGIAVNAVQTVQTVQKNKIAKNALGTAFSSGGASLVGEYGAEIVNLPRGSSVTPANKTQQILQGGKNVELHLHVAGNIYGEADFMNKIINRFTLELNKVMPV